MKAISRRLSRLEQRAVAIGGHECVMELYAVDEDGNETSDLPIYHEGDEPCTVYLRIRTMQTGIPRRQHRF